MPLKAHHCPVKLMGCGFVLTAVSDHSQKAWDALRAGVREIDRIESLISSWKDDSETAKINENAGRQPIPVSRELFTLIERSLKVSALTKGAFDISGTLARYYWNFNREENIAPGPETIQLLKELIDYRAIRLDVATSSVFLQKAGMKIGFGAIGKGYAAYQAHQVMKEMGIESGMINASGDLMCWGKPPQEEAWSVKIPHPKDPKLSLAQFSLPYGAVVTSGNFEHYTIVDGKKLSHIIDPRTGRPVESVKQVSVVCPNPEFADALATALSVLGPEIGVQLVNQLYGVECLMIDLDDQIYMSNQLKSFGICVN
jgi:thiamine biosynthesis lipoprotein